MCWWRYCEWIKIFCVEINVVPDQNVVLPPLWPGLPVCLQVRVMVRICSVHSSESSESMSLLKVDGRKKQLTLCETSAGGRSSASAPKTFLFDAIFSQDAAQVWRDKTFLTIIVSLSLQYHDADSPNIKKQTKKWCSASPWQHYSLHFIKPKAWWEL